MEKSWGDGSFGLVFKGTYHGESVAIKILKANVTNGGIQDFMNEIVHLKKLKYPYIVGIYGFFVNNEIPCMVTEYAQCGSVKQYINKISRSVDMKIRIKILLDVAKGLKFIHNNKYIHGDIKPANILLFKDDGYSEAIENAKITDFGTLKSAKKKGVNMNGVGTPNYMSPKILNRKPCFCFTDIFSFAITMYEVVKWGDAYEISLFPKIADVMEFIVRGERLEKPQGMPDKVYALIQGCWKEEPKDRTKIDEIIQGLRNIMSSLK